MNRNVIIGIILVLGLLLLTVAIVQSCHSGSEPDTPRETTDQVDGEGVAQPPSRPTPLTPLPTDTTVADTAATDTTATPQP